MKVEIESRIFAVLSSNDNNDITAFGVSLKEIGLKNSCIKLDNGDIVWECQCWWGPIDKFNEFINGRKINNVKIKE